MLGTRTVVELRCRKPQAEVFTKLWGYIEACPPVGDAAGISVLGGSIGEDSFTIRYSGFHSAVRVSGTLRSRSGFCEILLKFREERQSPMGVLVMACGLLAAAVLYPSRVDDWLRWGTPLVLGAISLFLPRMGTSPGFANAVADDIARLLEAERA
jgi:hypothetical protein